MNRSWMLAVILGAVCCVPARSAAQIPPQGVTVHGHWVIEVRNADGSLAAHQEFENALLSTGAFTLGTVMNGQKIDFWVVHVFTTGVCTGNNICITWEPEFRAGQPLPPHVFNNLTKSSTPTGIVLQGSFVAANAGQITEVRTMTEIGTLANYFTGTTLPQAISVQPTQSVSVSVTITFS